MDLFTRYEENPIVEPTMSGGGEKDYNPGVLFNEATDTYEMFFRKHFLSLSRWPADGNIWTKLLSFFLSFFMRDEWHSQIWRAESVDGYEWINFRPFLVPNRLKRNEKRGFEDPRIVYVEEFGYVLTYGVYDGRIVRMHIATSQDLVTWMFHDSMADWNFVGSGGVHVDWESDPLSVVLFNQLWPNGPDVRSKSGSAVPKLINGRLYFILGEGGIWVASCKPDFTDWRISSMPLLAGRPGTGYPDEVTTEAGPPLIWRPYGWLLLYHGINKRRKYQLMVAVLSHDLTRVLWRSTAAIFGPQEEYETRPGTIDVIPGAREALNANNQKLLKAILKKAVADGLMPGVTFVSACILLGQILRIWYGARDEVICEAKASLEDIEATIPVEIRNVSQI